ncbi:hypothetical protein acdb102_38030 [Acidothermaceae bacterium B102]|nr:hypothetical protein acdb102_38030 [Acidothermaceae bacterium B102]
MKHHLFRTALLLALPTLVLPVLSVTSARAASPTAVHVNFQPASVTAPAGYTADTGAAYNGTSGWQSLTGGALDMTANTRVRNSAQSPDKRYDTMVLMQETASSSGNKTPGQWVTALTNGSYTVTVGVGDATAVNSTYVITAQPGTADATTIVDHYVPTTSAPFSTQTKTVVVSAGQLVLSPAGGANTKIDFVDAVPVGGGGGGGGGGTGSGLTVTSPDSTTLALTTPRLVFSKIRGSGNPAARSFTFANGGTTTLSITGLAVVGANASDFGLASGQPTSLSIPAGGSATVSVVFHPADPTGCNSSSDPYAIGNAGRSATLTWHSNDPAHATGSADLGGIDACGAGGNNEAVLDEILPVLGYSTVVDNAGINRRYIGPLRWLNGTDEIISPYFKAADTSKPVSLTPIAHYAGPNTVPYGATGWYAQGAALNTASTQTCNAACQQLFLFPADPSKTTYNENQKLLPTPTGTTTFTPPGNFGVYNGDGTNVNFTDDSLNIDHTTANPTANVPVPHYLHDMRVYPAYGPGHVAIPNTYIIGIDITRVSAYHNDDFQDVILLLRNATPALAYGPQPGAATTVNLAAGGSVSPTCAVTGFDGVLPDTAGDQCQAANLAFTSSGLAMTSTAGQLANNNQQNALYKTFDATKGQFTVDAKVVGPVNYLTTDFQQIGAFFGPDQNNFVKVEAAHEGADSPHLTMFYRENGVSGTVGSVSLPAMTTSSTLDLIIRGNTTVPDPLPYGDTYGVSGFPLDQVSVFYSLNGGALVQVGSVKMPADVTGWFSKQAKAGILASNSGTTSPITATFSKFSITAP